MNAATSEPATQVLLVEDEPEIRQFICMALASAGLYQVTESGSVAAGLQQAGKLRPDIVILDLGLPGEDGLAFIRRFRSISPNPILVLSARGGEHDKVHALDAGADDYLTKPFNLAELQARLRALLRRSQPSPDTPSLQEFRFSDVSVDLAANTITRLGQPVHLTPIEYRLLTLLLKNTGKVLTHRFLLREVWGGDSVESSHYLRIYVSHLRQKLEADPTQPRHFLTETGIGYRFMP